jgi:hypothetical protein
MQIAYNVMWKRACYNNANCLQCNVEKSLLRQCQLLVNVMWKELVTAMQIGCTCNVEIACYDNANCLQCNVEKSLLG